MFTLYILAKKPLFYLGSNLEIGRRRRDSVTHNFLLEICAIPPREETAITLFEAYSFSTPCGFSVHSPPENAHKVFESLTPFSQKGSPPQFYYCVPKLRRRRDSNSRDPFEPAAFPRRWNKPLSDASILLRSTFPLLIQRTDTLVTRTEHLQIFSDGICPIEIDTASLTTNMRHNPKFFKYL